jgi:hypothetical protein
VVNETDLSRAVWRKSSRSGGYGENCVEIAGLDTAVAVRDSKNPAGPALIFRTAHWRTFARSVKHGTYDR